MAVGGKLEVGGRRGEGILNLILPDSRGNIMNYRNIIILFVAVLLVACGGPEERKAKYRARAQEYLEAGNYPKAQVALRNEIGRAHV